MNSCPANTKLVIKTSSNKLYVIPLIRYQFNLLAVKKMIEEKLYIQADQQELSFCNEVMSYDYQGMDIYHRYYHQKYGKCMYMLAINLKLK